jgi:NAD(P)-dependent dehydrogenase (short-subunit alcohol dehydrogenase family)
VCTGRIINISSVDSEVVSKGAERAVYSTAKAGVNHWTRMLASEMQPYNVNVNAIRPGATRTGLSPSLPPSLSPSLPLSLSPSDLLSLSPSPSLSLSLSLSLPLTL